MTTVATSRANTCKAHRSHLFAASAAVSLLCLMGASGAVAADAAAPDAPRAAASSTTGSIIDEITVTARRREERLQDVPAAVTAVSGGALVEAQVRNSVDLTQNVPSLTITNRIGHDGGTYAIRGLTGATSGSATVGTYFADVPTPPTSNGSDPSAGQALYDLSNVQVLKGPEGTLFGRTSVAGAVLVVPTAPSLTNLEGFIDVTEGNLGRQQITAAVNVPVIKDHLAVRVAYNTQHLNGYETVISSGQKLDETNNRNFRISVRFTPVDWIENTTIYDQHNVNAAPAAFVLQAYNPGLANFNFPATTTTFNAVCASAVANGYSPSVGSCVTQRLGILAQIKSDLAAEVARTSAGGKANRSVNADNLAFRDESYHDTLVNTLQISLPKVGRFETSLKDIFGYQKVAGVNVVSLSGIPDNLYNIAFGAGSGPSYNQLGTTLQTHLGKGNDFYSNEFQFSGKYDTDRVIWTAGYYYQSLPAVQDLQGLNVLQQTFGGTTQPGLGFTAGSAFTYGGHQTQKAVYGQVTFNFRGLIDGLELTLGSRNTQDHQAATTEAAVLNAATGVFSPSATQSTTRFTTSGTNYNITLDYHVNRDLLLYASKKRGYIPGGINNPVGSGTLPNYAPIYGSEFIVDYEYGVKWDFNINNVRGRINLNGYNMNFTDIQETYAAVNAAGANVTYTGNVAEAKLKGVELEAFVRPTDDIDLNVSYSFNDAKYTTWTGADPTSVAPAGTILNLANNPFSNNPRNKLTVSGTYRLPVLRDYGQLSLNASVYTQSRIWFSTFAQRILDLYGAQNTNAISQKAYSIVNARLDWDDVMNNPNLRASLFVRNLGNTLYASGGLVQLYNIGIATKTFAEPRTFGVQFSYKFGE